MALKTLKEQAATDLAALFSSELPWVDSIKYTPKDDFTRTIPAQIMYEENLKAAGGSEPAMAGMSIQVKKSDVPEPDYDDKYEYEDEVWHMRRIEKGDSYTWNLRIERDKRPAFRR
jgi:hypothetical protein